MTRYIAIDWSGSASVAVQKRSIVAADWQDGVVSISSGRTRYETTVWLIEQARQSPRMVVGLDFAFSFPAWFVRQEAGSAGATIEDFWRMVADRGESWLNRDGQAPGASPFWGRRLPAGGGTPCPEGHREPGWLGYRQADRSSRPGIQPKSPFQIGGAGAVGTGSIRGIPELYSLRKAGFSIWPFHAPALPIVMEIYPRSFTGPVNKSDRDARTALLQQLQPCPDAGLQLQAAESEDAFDAYCSVLGMAQQAEDIRQLRQAKDEITLLEGSIFPGRPILQP